MKQVFEPTTIANMTLQNRILRSATHENMSDENGYAKPELMHLYERMAKNQVGGIITGFTGVHRNGKASRTMRMIDDDKYISDYQELNKKMQQYGVPLIMQLAHGGGQCSPTVTGSPTLAPSSIKPKNYPTRPVELNQEQIEQIITSFVDAIERAQKAGFSGVQLHGAHGYLLSEFLSPFYNRRQDRWGGNTENRYRIVGEIIRQARLRSGAFPIWIKINANESIRNGMRVEEAIKIAKLLEKSGCDAIEVSCGASVAFDTIRVKEIPIEAALNMMPSYANQTPIKKSVFKLLAPFIFKHYTPLYNYNVDAAWKIKQQVSIPIIVVGGIRSLQDIEEIIQQEKADYVAMSRPFIIEPGIVAKFASGEQDESRCIDCGYCLFGLSSSPLRCYYGKIPASYRKE